MNHNEKMIRRFTDRLCILDTHTPQHIRIRFLRGLSDFLARITPQDEPSIRTELNNITSIIYAFPEPWIDIDPPDELPEGFMREVWIKVGEATTPVPDDEGYELPPKIRAALGLDPN
jgi:hypothetical protein